MKEIPRSNGYFKWLFSIVLLTVSIGCMHYSLVTAGKTIRIGNLLKVESSINWSKSEINGVETWTIDGPRLQRLMFFKRVKDNKPLLKIKGVDEKNTPLYKSSMTPIEIMELIEAALARSGGHKIVKKDLRPESFGGLDGFRFEFNFITKNGLKYNGFVVGAKKDDRLLTIMYLGTALYYYEKYLEDVEKIISSIEIL